MLPVFALVILIVLLFGLRLFKYRSRKAQSSVTEGVRKVQATAVGRCELVEPLFDFDYRKQEPIPYRPFQSKQHVAMGIKKMAKSEWIRIDKGYLDRIEERKQVIREHEKNAIGSGEIVNPAIQELYEELMCDYLPKRFPTMFSIRGKTLRNKVTGMRYSIDIAQLDHATMLRNLAENVEEDFYIMCPDEKDEPRLQGYLGCFPGGFLSPSRLGQSMREIHSPVPGYEQRIGKGADRALARLGGNEFIERFNWSLQTDGPDLFRVDGNNFYPEQGQTIPEEEDKINIADCYLRVEHQTLTRLEKSRAIIFCVRSYMTSLHDIKKEGSGPLLADAFESMPEKLGGYKKRPFWYKDVFQYLRS